MTIGSTGNLYELLLDTGSSELWIFYCDSKIEICDDNQIYDSAKSRSFHKIQVTNARKA